MLNLAQKRHILINKMFSRPKKQLRSKTRSAPHRGSLLATGIDASQGEESPDGPNARYAQEVVIKSILLRLIKFKVILNELFLKIESKI